MPKVDPHEFDEQRGKVRIVLVAPHSELTLFQLVSGLVACAEQLRNTAKVVEDFAQYINGLDGMCPRAPIVPLPLLTRFSRRNQGQAQGARLRHRRRRRR